MATEPQRQTFTCIVCGEPVTVAMSAECNWCDGRYHLNQRNDVEGKDCGVVWVDEQYLVLQFACQTCLAGQSAASGGGPTAREPAPAASPRPGASRPRRYKRRE